MLVKYVFTSEFFLTIDGIDAKAMDSIDMEKDFRIIYKKKPKTINLCPYCRAIIASIVSLPFVYLWRKIHKNQNKPKTHAQIMKSMERRGHIIRLIGGGINIAFGIKNIVFDEQLVGIIQIGIGIALIVGYKYIPDIIRQITIRWPAKKQSKPKSQKLDKKQSKLVKTISEKHDLICPPIWFVHKNDVKDLV